MNQKLSAAPDMAAIVQEAINLLPGGFIIYGPNHEILLANEKSERHFAAMLKGLRSGLSFRDAISEAVKAVASSNLSDEAAKTIADGILAASQRGEPLELKAVDGSIVQAIEIPLSFGGSVTVGADITALRDRERELKKARKAADSANEAKSAFLANISHEIRTPLNGILGMTQLLASTNLSDEQRDHIETILDSGKTLMAILNDVLDLSKIEAGRFDILPIDNEFDHLLRRLNKLWSPRAAEKGLGLEFNIPSDMVSFLRFDPVRVRQCISNLVSNAIKFTERGKVTISTHVEHLNDDIYEVRLSVTDTGMGMNQETLEKLFTPFTQADATTARQYGGTGLGLSISQKLARLMGGDIVATSKEGEGSTFTLTFRATAGTRAENVPENMDVDQTGGTDWARGLAVLLVDDHPLNRKVARLFLEPHGVDVVEAVDGAEALRAMEIRAFDLVLLDMHMPVMDGPEVLARMRMEGSPLRDVPVIALTADSLGSDNMRYTEMGADGYIPKPIDHRELILEIGHVLELRRNRAPMAKEAIEIKRA